MMNNTYCLSEKVINDSLQTKFIGKTFHLFGEMSSTFDIPDSIPLTHGMVICTGRQTNGRGRSGRTWESGHGGIYFSIILTKTMPQSELNLLTIRCATAVCSALNKYTPCAIKWPNDIISESGKKLCGILTRIQTPDTQTSIINIGIGINANNGSFGSSLPHASSLKNILGNSVDENEVLCRVLTEIEKCLSQSQYDIITKFTQMCVTINSRVKILFHDSDKFITGTCVNLNDDGSLTIKTDSGTFERINSGEVSVRGVYGENYV